MITAEVDVHEMPALSTKRQVAKWAGCSDRQIDLLVKVGQFPSPVRLGHHPRWTRSSLMAWLNEQSQQPDAE